MSKYTSLIEDLKAGKEAWFETKCVIEQLEAENAQLVKQLDLHKLNHEHGEALTDLSQSIGVDDGAN